MSLNYWRTPTGLEVDFILDERIAIEVKAKRAISQKDLKGLLALREEGGLARKMSYYDQCKLDN